MHMFSLVSVVFGFFIIEKEALLAANPTDVFSFVVICILIITLFYSFIKLRSKNNLIEQQNAEILQKNKQLQLQNQNLQKISEEKSNLVSVVSHDLKSPLNRIFALLNLLKITSEKLTEEQLEYLSKMHQVIKDGMALIRNLLDIRAIEDEGIITTPEKVDALRLVNDTLKAHKPLADIKEISFKLNRQADEAIIISDKLYISRILDNLISNAIKFSENGKTIEVNINIDEVQLTISVLDQGPGLSDEDMTNLFHKFRVLSAKPTDGESSTGLGLSIVKSLAENLGGTVKCKSVLGDGAKFTLTLPLKIETDG